MYKGKLFQQERSILQHKPGPKFPLCHIVTRTPELLPVSLFIFACSVSGQKQVLNLQLTLASGTVVFSSTVKKGSRTTGKKPRFQKEYGSVYLYQHCTLCPLGFLVKSCSCIIGFLFVCFVFLQPRDVCSKRHCAKCGGKGNMANPSRRALLREEDLSEKRNCNA